MGPIRHILVAVDLHGASMRALSYGARLARSVGAQLTVLHSYDAEAHAAVADLPPPVPIAELRVAAEREVGELVTTLRQHGLEAKAAVRGGAPVNEILETTREVDADLVVLGTHGRRGLSRLVLGSVAEQVVRRSSVPVVTLHEWRFENRGEAARQLARKVEALRGELDVTIAITRGAVPIAIDLARVLGTPVDVLLAEPIVGPREMTIGAVCEDSSFLIDPAAVDANHVDSDSVAHAADAARSIVYERAHWLADPNGRRPVAGERVLLVSDLLVAPEVALVAARAVTRHGAKHVTLAVPVCAASVLDALPPAIDSTVCIEATQLESPSARVYHDEGAPSNIEAAEMLVRESHRNAAASGAASNR
jgi:nucleotide-binding universal stress UspA family protein/predicted phosphoribosyltransferase